MERLTKEKYRAKITGSKILSSDRYGSKVFQLKDHSILKLFRTKRLISSARIYPYSLRFKHNATRLSYLGVPTISILDSFKIPHLHRTAIRYKPLKGRTLRDYLLDNPITDETANRLSQFVASLHQEGIFFRSIHFGNIMIMANQSFGLIDVSDMKIKSHRLSFRMRLRNFRHFTRYNVDKKLIQPKLKQFLDNYSRLSDLSQNQCEILNYNFRLIFAHRATQPYSV